MARSYASKMSTPQIEGPAALASLLPRELDDEREDDAKMTEVRVLLGVLGVLLLVGFAAGCGLVSDQTKQEAKKKVEAKGQQAKQEAKKKIEAKGQQVKQEVKKKVEAGQEDLKEKVDDLQKKVEVGKEDLEQKVDDVHKDVNDLEKKVDELLKKVDAQEQQDQKK
jgi:gas vesicle protein